ncbi:flagellar protein FlaG protein [Clostridium sp. DL-VIII]|uniref:flagellar protein FlaG n=1 Tax=Clostridium sp. DL-VIII TaxID=641107 RepID=UPI00023B0640|nr:flagellar protein FlaG [Clostridium sp. DL-VIII]EHJ01511.1 flagellar protein FlaG protein [Clostridium sp. DL-VIII]
MDVNNLQNPGDNNLYKANISEYTPITDVAVPQVAEVQKIDNQSEDSDNQEYSKKDLDEALKKLNNFLKDEHTHAEYSYYKDLKTTMIKIVDEDTKEVLLEIPPKKILDMIASMCRQVGLIDKKA